MDTNDDISDDPSSGDSNGEGNSDTNGILRKGPWRWSAEEDAILLDYIAKHGEGNWNACQRFSGLSRCGKSCRLRWVNQLRPNLKKGDFTPEEERVVIELHAKLGNKWSRMAAKLLGRTDNEIKNFWNTRVKRFERNGEPVYPPDVCIEIQSESQQSPNSGSVSNNLASPHSFIETINTELPEFKIECHPDSGLYGSYTDPNSFYNITIRSSLPRGRGRGPSHTFSCMSSSMHPQGLGPYGSFSNMSRFQSLSPSKGLNPSGNLSHMSPSMRSHDQLQEFDRIPHGLKDTASSLFIGHTNFDDSELQQQHQSNQLPPLPGICFRTDEPPLCISPDSHTLINGNGNPSTSNLAYFGSARSMGLPSLQMSVINSSFGAAPPSLCPFVQPSEVRPDQIQCTQLNRLGASMVENCYQTDPKEKTTGYFNGSFDFPLCDWEKEIPPICPSDPYFFGGLAPLPEYPADEPQPNDDMLGPHIKTSDAEHSTIQNNNKDLYQFEPSEPNFSISELETVGPIAAMSPSDPNSFSHLPGYFADEQQPTNVMFGIHVSTSDANLHQLDSNMWINEDMLIPDCELRNMLA
ncbi:unnamed protein product [Rhodiola kirilowii]